MLKFATLSFALILVLTSIVQSIFSMEKRCFENIKKAEIVIKTENERCINEPY